MLDGKTIYVAHPIDFGPVAEVSAGAARLALNDAGAVVYRPMQAFQLPSIGKPHDGIYQVNMAALEECDALVALHPDSLTVGVPMEIERARSLGMPIIVITETGNVSWSLAGSGALVVSHLTVDNLRWLAERLDAPGVTLKFNRADTTFPKVPPKPELVWSPSVNGVAAIHKAPTRGYAGDAGWDLYTSEAVTILPGQALDVPCGVRFALPPNTWGMVIGRSSTRRKEGLLVHTAVIDGGYLGDMFALVENLGGAVYQVEVGQRLAQFIPMPLLAEGMNTRYEDMAQFGTRSSDRGTAGFGSSGR